MKSLEIPGPGFQFIQVFVEGGEEARRKLLLRPPYPSLGDILLQLFRETKVSSIKISTKRKVYRQEINHCNLKMMAINRERVEISAEEQIKI